MLGEGEQLLVERGEQPGRDRGAPQRIVGLLGHLLVRQVVELRGEVLLHPLVRVGHAPVRGLGELLDVLRADQPVRDELRGEQLAHRRMLADLQVHERLRVRRLVGLVVAEAPVPDEVDHHVPPVGTAVVVRERDRGEARLDVVGVDVHDRDVEALGEVRGVPRRPALLRIGGEPDLVVGDEVHRAAGRVARQRLEVEHLLHHALPGERSVPVDEHRERGHRIEVQRRRAALGLRRTAPPLHHRVDRVEVARIGEQPDEDHLAGLGEVRARSRPCGT